MNTSLKFLIGCTYEGTILLGEINHRGGEFSFCCDELDCIQSDRIDKEEEVYCYLECCDDEYKYKLCEYYACSPAFLEQFMIDSFDDEIERYFDVDYTFDVDGYLFNLIACGQHDPRELFFSNLYISPNIFDTLMYCWDNYHLKQMPKATWNSLYDALFSASVEDDYVAEWVENILR